MVLKQGMKVLRILDIQMGYLTWLWWFRLNDDHGNPKLIEKRKYEAGLDFIFLRPTKASPTYYFNETRDMLLLR
jgi:hypothetical protein